MAFPQKSVTEPGSLLLGIVLTLLPTLLPSCMSRAPFHTGCTPREDLLTLTYNSPTHPHPLLPSNSLSYHVLCLHLLLHFSLPLERNQAYCLALCKCPGLAQSRAQAWNFVSKCVSRDDTFSLLYCPSSWEITPKLSRVGGDPPPEFTYTLSSHFHNSFRSCLRDTVLKRSKAQRPDQLPGGDMSNSYK